MKTLASFGCSYSDYCGDSIKATYGQVAAKLINYDYLHMAEGCSSKDRIYKLCVSAVLDGRLKSGDLVVVQWPDPHRMELPSAYNLYIDNIPDDVKTTQQASLRSSPFGQYFYHNWKPRLNDYENEHHLDDSFRSELTIWSDTYEKLIAVSNRYVLHQWQILMHLFEAFLEKHNIDYIPYLHQNTGFWLGPNADSDLFQEGIMTSNQKYRDNALLDDVVVQEFQSRHDMQEFWLGWDTIKGVKPIRYDDSHRSQLAHAVTGEVLAEHILAKIILKDK